jgi:uncharacterized membrane protein YfcA
MTGMGGGSLMTPLLVLVFGFKPSVGRSRRGRRAAPAVGCGYRHLAAL